MSIEQKRAFFLGAGASRADGFPVTSEIIHALAYAVREDPRTYRRVRAFLKTIFRVDDAEIARGAARWDELPGADGAPSTPDPLVPDIVELLSLLDVLIADESLVAAAPGEGEDAERPFRTRELLRIRDQTGRALAWGFHDFEARMPKPVGGLARAFADALRTDDVVVTTNWDLLMDRALHARFRTTSDAVGSDVEVIGASGEPAPTIPRPPLYKLHGSFNWLQCQRCTRLYVNPEQYIAEKGFFHRPRDQNDRCECTMPLTALLITPTYFKEYRSRHLLNIWSRAQLDLAKCSEWYFVGYSLPTDDVHIRALLLRALHLRLDAGGGAPRIILVTRSVDAGMRTRFERLFRSVEVCEGGFEAFIQDGCMPPAPQP